MMQLLQINTNSKSRASHKIFKDPIMHPKHQITLIYAGVGIPPLAVICKDVHNKDLFQERLMDVYRYEVHGGLHGIKARQELNEEGYSFERVSCHVYAGLSDEEALWLASRHNANGHFHHTMTHRDYVSLRYVRIIIIITHIDACM